MLDESGARSIVLSAPAGYGKTALVVEWLADGRNCTWYSASAASSNLQAFSLDIASAAEQIVPRVGHALRARTTPTPARAAAQALANDLTAWPDDAWLVVDDYHEAATCPDVDEFVGSLMDLAPIRLLVGTRSRPSWASTRRALYGELLQLGPSELALSAEEVTLLLGEHASEAAQALVDRAEGWPALVSLARRSSSASDPDTRLCDHVLRFLAEEVFRTDVSGTAHLLRSAALLTSVADDAGTGATRNNGRSRLPQLTPRENEVLELMSDGLGNGEIAKTLFISEKTAKVHVSHIFEKLGVGTRVQAVIASRRTHGGPAGLGLEH